LDVLVGQLFVVHLDPRKRLMDALHAHRENHYGGVFFNRENLIDVDRARRLTFRFRRHTRELPPPLVTVDEEGGLVTNTGHLTTPAPSPAALGALDDEEVTQDVYFGIGEKLRALGFNTVFAPDLDVNVEPRNPVIGTRSFGPSPEKVARHGEAAVAGLNAAGIVACAKHFPGHGATSQDSHETLPVVEGDRDLLEGRELEPFRRILGGESPPDLAMTAHVSFPAWERRGVPATLAPSVLQGVLRRDLGFQGLVISDAMEMKGITGRYGPERAAVEAILAGVDLVLFALDPGMARAACEGVKEAVRSGKISEDRLHQSVDRALRLRDRFRNLPWMPDAEARDILEIRHEPPFFQAAMEGISLEGNAGVLAEIPGAEGPKVVVLPRQVDETRHLPLQVVREQLEPAGFAVLDVAPRPSAEEISRLEGQVAAASVVVVGVASRGEMAEENKRLVAALTRRDVIKVGVALLDPPDADQMMTTNCRMKTYGCTVPHLWAMCQRLLG
jgi:beta-N-acetylhexosaminidase